MGGTWAGEDLKAEGSSVSHLVAAVLELVAVLLAHRLDDELHLLQLICKQRLVQCGYFMLDLCQARHRSVSVFRAASCAV